MSRLIITGGGGSGKDYLKKKLVDKGFKYDVSYTTRPIRDGEKDGITYHYITDEKFKELIRDNKFIQFKEFRGWWYGTHRLEWSTKDVFIQTPEGIASLPKEDREKSLVMYINIPEHIREKRLRERNDSDDVERRLSADRDQFKDFKDFDMEITNPLF